MIYLETPRLLLRSWRDEDLHPFAAMNADERVMEYFPAPLSQAESAAFLERMRQELAQEPFGPYAVERREDGKLLGYVGLHRITFAGELTGRVEIGWRLCAEAWGHGYATEAARACLDHARQLGLGEIVAFTTLSNLRSQRVMERLGMARQYEFDHPALPVGDRLRRHVLYSI